MKRQMTQSESGAVSLFIVIFSALLMTIITVAFIRIMIQDQTQATTSDLSKGALDSAYDGVEDAKRAILQYQTQCGSDADAADASCVNARKIFDSNSCDTLQQLKIASASAGTTDPEVKVQQSPSDPNDPDLNLAQAYTCVTIKLNTPDYEGDLTANSSRLIHLKPSTGSTYNAVNISWFSQQDMQNAASGSNEKVNLNADPNVPLPTLSEKDPTVAWPKTRPPLMRTQLLQFDKKTGFNLSDFDSNSSNASLFLYPSDFGTGTTDNPLPLAFTNDFRMSQAGSTLQPVTCDDTYSSAGGVSTYACNVVISVPSLPDNDSRDAYLRISELYSTDTNFSVSMGNYDPTQPVAQRFSAVDFNAVQPSVDSTGRANDLFRRVNSRIDLESSSIPDVQNGVDINGNLCKDFIVTDDPSDYINSCRN